MLVLFVFAKGRIAGMGPLCGVTPEGALVPGFVVMLQGVFGSAVKGAGAIVTEKENQRVVVDALLLELFNDFPIS